MIINRYNEDVVAVESVVHGVAVEEVEVEACVRAEEVRASRRAHVNH